MAGARRSGDRDANGPFEASVSSTEKNESSYMIIISCWNVGLASRFGGHVSNFWISRTGFGAESLRARTDSDEFGDSTQVPN